MTKRAPSDVRFIHVTPQPVAASNSQSPTSSSVPEIKLKPAVKRARQRVPDDQRKRVRHACDSCRGRKEKCYGGTPCDRCVKSNIQCVVTRPHGAGDSQQERPGDKSNLTDADRVKCLKKIVSRHLGGVSLSDEDLKSMANSPDGERDTDLEGEDFSVKVLSQNRMYYSGENSLLNLSQRLKQKVARKTEVDVGEEVEDPKGYSRSVSGITQLRTSSSTLCSLICRFPDRQVANFLVDTFFKYTQCNNFYVDVEWLQKKLDIYYCDSLALGQEEVPSLCIVLMILAIGTQYAHMDSAVSVEDLGRTIFDEVSRTIPDIITAKALECVQACLLIGVYLFPVDQPGLAFTYLGLGLNIAIQNGMHRKSSSGTVVDRGREVRNRVWWTLFIFYQQTSILHGYPKTMSHVEVDVERPQRLQELEPRTGTSNFENQLILIDLIIILEDISSEISNLRKSQNAVHFMNLMSLRQKLIRQESDLPVVEYEITPDMRLDALRLNLHLHLHYQRTRLFLGRPFLLVGHETRSSTTRASSDTPPNRHSYRDILVQDSVAAALKIIELCQALHQGVGLAQASYSTEFTSCRAAMLVLLAASLSDKSNKLREALSRGLKIIKIMSAGGGDLATSETRVIEALERAISRLNSYENNSRSTAEQQPTGGADSGKESHNNYINDSNYAEQNNNQQDHFRRWEMLWQMSPLSHNTSQPSLPMNYSAPADQSAADSVALRDINCDPHVQQQYQDPADEFGQVFGHFPMELNEFSVIPEFDFELGLGGADLGGYMEDDFL